MSNQNDYSVAIKEIHHTQKLDAPSGTAISLAEQIIENHAGYAKWNLDTGVIDSQDSIPITAERTDEVPGTHLVTYASEIDKIVLMHEAHNRKGFALGAVLAAEFLKGKKGIFDMTHLLEHTLS
jgi:4-hydroxy-tetrahydrodipicolinate reductase